MTGALIAGIVFGACAWAVSGACAEGRLVPAMRELGSIDLNWDSTVGRVYQVQRAVDPGGRFWTDEGPPRTATGPFSTSAVPAPASDPGAYFQVLAFTNAVFWHDWRYHCQRPTLSDWGMGTNAIAYAGVDRPYDWYIDQVDTGPCAHNNCGPSSAVMALRWRDRSFAASAADARASSPRDCAPWFTYDILNYFATVGADYTTSAYRDPEQLRHLVSERQLILLCLDVGKIQEDFRGEHRVGRFYYDGAGHFLVVKGWRETSSGIYFEVYDSASFGMTYADGTPRGRNRYLEAMEVDNAIRNWWPYIIVIHPISGPPRHAWESALDPVSPSTINHAAGR